VGAGSRGAGYDYLAKTFGGSLSHSVEAVSVGTARVLASPHDGERVSLTFVNLGTTVVYISPEPLVSTTRGIRLGPSGGMVGVNVTQDATLPMAEWWAAGDAAGGTLFVIRGRRETAATD